MISKSQFELVLLSKNVEMGLERLQENGTLLTLFPEVQGIVGFGGQDEGHKDLWDHTKRVVAQCVPKARVRWAALFHDVGKPRCIRENDKGEIAFYGHEAVSAKYFQRAVGRTGFFRDEEAQHIHFLIYNLGMVSAYEASWSGNALRRLHKHVGSHFEDLVSLARADITTKSKAKREAYHQKLHELVTRTEEILKQDAIPPALPTGLGDAISKEFKIPPSPALGRIMGALKDAVENGDLPRQAPIQELLAFVKARGLAS